MSLISAGSISLDSTFKWAFLTKKVKHFYLFSFQTTITGELDILYLFLTQLGKPPHFPLSKHSFPPSVVFLIIAVREKQRAVGRGEIQQLCRFWEKN
jgi:hypothetical protein